MTRHEIDRLSTLEAEYKDLDKAYIHFCREKILTDLYWFGAEFLEWGDYHVGKRRRIDPSFHRWLAHLLEKDEDTLILVPRGHLKSSWVKLRIVQKILQNPNVRILLCSVTSRLVYQELQDIKRIFADPRLRMVFSDFIPEPGKDYINWEKSTADQLTVKRVPEMGHVPQGPQILAVGAGAKITGFHFDIGFLDDPVNEDTTNTADQMQKTEDFWSYLIPIMEGNPIIITGTPYHMNDLYAVLEREGIITRVYKRSIVENGKPIYKSWLSLKEIERMKRAMRDEWKWACQFECNPRPDDRRIFTPPFQTFDNLPPGKYTWYMTVDPAATTERYSDNSGLTVAAVNELGWLYYVESQGVKLPGDKLADLIIEKVMQYKPHKVGIEFGLQEHLKHIIGLKVSEISKINRLPELSVLSEKKIEPVKISRAQSKAQRIATSLGAFVRDGKCFFQSEKCKSLMVQMVGFTGSGKEHDDQVDSASMIFSVASEFSMRYWTVPQFFKPRGTFRDLVFTKPKNTWESRFAS